METLVKYDIKEISWPEKTFITKRALVTFDKLTEFFGKNYGEIYGQINKLGIASNDPPCAIYYSLDEVKKVTDLAAAVPVEGKIPEIKGFERITIPKSKAITVTYFGSYENMGPVYVELEKYLAEHKLKRQYIIEEYLTDPAVEKDPAKMKTRIYFILN